MATIREPVLVKEATPTREGAGVQLRRAFGFGAEERFDPFLMLDDFRGTHPSQYSAGFPAHPHRGIETITYVLEGTVDHEDSLGNAGTIGPGDVQWMTAGGGIIHQEMPHGDEHGHMGGFQLWANLPHDRKMTAPRYRGVPSAEIPEVSEVDARVRVIAGEAGGAAGAVRDIVIEPLYLDVTLPARGRWEHSVPLGHAAFAYLFEGAASFGSGAAVAANTGTVVLLGDGDSVQVHAEDDGARFLFVAGKPIHEPVAWRGPVVMNTREELQQAWDDLEAGTFARR